MLNQATIDLVKEFEGLRTAAYKDSAGVWTIGYGTTGRAGVGVDPVEGMEITEAEAEHYLQKGLEKFSTEITGAITPADQRERVRCFRFPGIQHRFRRVQTINGPPQVQRWRQAGRSQCDADVEQGRRRRAQWAHSSPRGRARSVPDACPR